MENAYKMKVLSLVEKVYPVVGGVDMLGVKKKLKGRMRPRIAYIGFV